MSEVFEINKEFLFKTNIHEISSISVEYNFDVIGSNVEGFFDVTGDYRLHEISINKEDFSFKIPFSHEINENINLDTIEIEITDFNYEFKNGDELKVHIEYKVSGEQNIIEFEDEKTLNEFLDNNEAEIIDLKDEVKEETKEEKELPKIEESKISNLNDRDIDLDIIENKTNEIEIPKVSDENINK